MASEFLTKEEANDYYAAKSPFYKQITQLPHVSVVKVFPGRKFILYSIDGPRVIIYASLRANVITMDRNGLCILFKGSVPLRVGYIPEPVTTAMTVFLSIPSKNWVERTLRRSRPTGAVMESTALGMFVAQKYDQAGNEGPVFVSYEEFKKRTGRIISEFEG